MQNNNIAIGFLTHNHPETVKEVMNQTAALYYKYGMDLYFLDDSDDDATKKIIEDIQKDYSNVFRVDLVGKVSGGDEKWFNFVSGKYCGEKKYKYIFPLKDRIIFSEKVIKSISEQVQNEYDVIMVANEFDRWEFRFPQLQDVYDSPELFFYHYGNLTTNWRSMIYKTDTILEKDRLTKIKKEFNLGEEFPFNQTITTFAGLADLDNPLVKIIHIWDNRKDIIEYTDLGARSNWLNNVYDLWAIRWVNAINMLPNIYDEFKALVIKSETNCSALFGSTDALMMYKEKNAFTYKEYNEIKNVWYTYSDVPKEEVEMILNDKITKLVEHIFEKFEKQIKDGDFEDAFYTFFQNNWLKKAYGPEKYNKIWYKFVTYRFETLLQGYSNTFDGVKSLDDIIN